MYTRYPSYYKKFKCIANRCQGSCCSAGWEIDIDKKTAEFYKTISSEFGNELHRKIDFRDPAHFILEKNGRCPFLNEKNLCDIYINLGEHNLCQICNDHPRFYQCFNNVIECGLGVYCEEACRIILSETEKFSTYDVETDDDIKSSYNLALYSYLSAARAEILNYLSDKSKNIFSRIKDVLWYANTLQQNIDFDMLDTEKIFSVNTYGTANISELFDILLTLTPNKIEWFDYIQDCKKHVEKNEINFHDFLLQNSDFEKYVENLAVYFIYRYFLSGVFDEDVLSKVKLMVYSIATITTMFILKWHDTGILTLTDCVFIIKRYSEEIECCDENIEKIYELSYENEILSTENLLNIFKF